MTGAQIRTRFLEHFAGREHLVLPSAPLVPQQDPTTLLISAGMHPLKSYFQGVSGPPAPRLASCQKCFRTPDLEEVGKTDRHCTFFEMLGNFAPTGDYFKETAIPLAWELVTDGFQLPAERLRVTIHPSDDQAYEIWTRSVGVPADWVYRDEENWWSAGETGPCGPDSELWYDRGPEQGCGGIDCYPNHCDRYLEFWNLVFMQYDRQADGSLPPLPRPGIDTGMGLERMASILQGVNGIFETDLFAPIVDRIRQHSRREVVPSQRLVADHLRGMTFLVADGVHPGNEGRGYVLRRLIRRATLHARRLQLAGQLAGFIDVVIALMRGQYPELEQRQALIRSTISQEQERFTRTLENGLQQFERIAAKHDSEVPGSDVFLLHDTYGFPIELTRELAEERSMAIDMTGFEAAMEQQRARSRTMTGQRWPDLKALPRSRFIGYTDLDAKTRIVGLRRNGDRVEQAAEGEEVEVFLEATPFYAEAGGQIGDTGKIAGPSGWVRVDDAQSPAEGVIAHMGRVALGTLADGEDVSASVDAGRRHQIARHHSATHLLHKALREVMGEGAVQKGSWVGPDHTTFDFPLSRPLQPVELQRIHHRVSDQVRAALPFHERRQPYREAVRQGVMHLFEEKYGDIVRVVCFGGWTCELCGGTHVENTADIGAVVVLSESSIGAGLRRIDMVVGEAAESLIQRRLGLLGELARTLGVAPDDVVSRVAELRARLRQSEKEIARLQDELRVAQVRGGVKERNAGVGLVMETVEARDLDDLRSYADRYMEQIHSGVVAVTSHDMFVIKVSRDLARRYDASRFTEFFGRGGGRADLAQGKLTHPPEEAFQRLEVALR
jgi:alanyl-tRNA synthetase